jgi:hypothetical protein
MCFAGLFGEWYKERKPGFPAKEWYFSIFWHFGISAFRVM